MHTGIHFYSKHILRKSKSLLLFSHFNSVTAIKIITLTKLNTNRDNYFDLNVIFNNCLQAGRFGKNKLE